MNLLDNNNMKNLVLVIDYQNDFVDGALGFEDAPLLYEGIKERIKEAEKNKDEIIFTKDTHLENYMETCEGKNLPVPHCIKDSFGHKLYKDLEEISKKHTVVEKYTFGSKELFELLKDKEYDYIEIFGVVTNICVVSNAVIIKSLFPNTDIVVNSKLCGSNDKVLEQKAYDILKNLHIKVI